MDKKQIWLHNLKIHYIWTFFSSFVFLSPVISLYYLNYNLEISDIILLTALYRIFLFILEIPTSTIWDTWSKSKTMFLSAIFSFLSALLYFLFPFYFIFIIAVFFSALAQALWSGTGHAKLEEDLNAAWMKDDFAKVLGRLIALLRLWTLLTPVFIFYILKTFSNGYEILAFIDVIIWWIVLFYVAKFKDLDKSGYKKFSWNFKENINIQIKTLKDSFYYLKNNKNLLLFLLLILLWTDWGLLVITYLPIIVDINSIEDYFASVFTLWVTISSILGWLLAHKISKKIENNILIAILFIILWIGHILTSLFNNNIIVLSWIIMLSTFVWVVVFTIWNTKLVKLTQVNHKSTTRSIFMSLISLYSFFILFVLSKLSLEFAFFIIGIIIILSWIMFLFFHKKI